MQKSMCHISDGKMQVSWTLLHCGRLLSTELWLPTPRTPHRPCLWLWTLRVGLLWCRLGVRQQHRAVVLADVGALHAACAAAESPVSGDTPSGRRS